MKRALLALATLSGLALPALAATDIWETTGGPAATGTNASVIPALAVSPDGQTVYAGSGAGTVHRWVYGDAVPAAFDILDLTNQALSTAVTTSAITVADINTSVTATTTVGTLVKNGTDTTLASVSVSVGDTVAVKLTTSGSNSTTISGTLTIGGVSDTFSVTTLAPPTPVNGTCGSAHGSAVTSAPGSNLCTAGTASAVSGSGPWTWSCAGTNGGTTANCTASLYVAPPPPPPPPPPVNLPTTGGSATVTGGGQTIVVSVPTTGSGTDGSTTINLAAGTSGPATNTLQLPGGGNLSVTHSGSAQVSVTTVGGNSVLAVTSGTVTVAATQAGQPLASTGNGGILVSANQSGASVTVSASPNGAPTLNVSGGTTLNLSGSPAQMSGTVIQLAGGNASAAPVVIQTGSSAGGTLSIVPGSGGGQLGVQTVTQADGSRVTALAVTSGTVTLTIPSSGNASLVVGNGQVTTGADHTQMTVTVNAGEQILFVGSGYIILPTRPSARTRANQMTRAARTEMLPDGKLYAGETAVLDDAGNLLAAYIGSSGGDMGMLGDRLPVPAVEGLALNPVLPRLSGASVRLNADLETTIKRQLQASGLTVSADPDPLGACDISLGQQTYRGMPSGRVAIDARRPDGIEMTGNGAMAVSQDGVTVTYAPGVANIEALAAFVKAMGGNIALRLNTDGSYVAAFSGGHRYALQPGYAVTSLATTESLSEDGQGHIAYVDPQGRQQVFYPVAADFATLEREVRRLDPTATLSGNAAGKLSLTLAGQRFTLTPDYHLVQAPADKQGQTWWIGADGKLYVRVPFVFANYAQGFAVE